MKKGRLIFPVIDNIQTAVWISNNTLTWAASHLSVPEHCISATCWHVSPEIFLGCTQSKLVSGDNYFRQPSGLVVRGADVLLGPEQKLCPCVRCFTGARHECFALNAMSVHFWRIAKWARSGGLAVTCLDSPPTDRPADQRKRGEGAQACYRVSPLTSGVI